MFGHFAAAEIHSSITIGYDATGFLTATPSPCDCLYGKRHSTRASEKENAVYTNVYVCASPTSELKVASKFVCVCRHFSSSERSAVVERVPILILRLLLFKSQSRCCRVKSFSFSKSKSFLAHFIVT